MREAAPASRAEGGGLRAAGVSVALLLALLAALIAYYWGHKPFEPVTALLIGGALLDMATAAALLSVCAAVGRVLLGRIPGVAPAFRTRGVPARSEVLPPPEVLSPPERAAAAVLVGAAVVTAAAMLTSLAGVMVGREAWLALALAGVLARHGLAAWWADVRASCAAALPRTPAEAAAALALGVLVLSALVYALNPPTRWDALTYHLVGPARVLREGRLLAAPDNFYLGLPELIETLYRLCMSLFGRDTAPAVVHWALGVFGVAAAAGTAYRISRGGALNPRAAGWLCALLLLGAFSLWSLFRWPYVDLGVLACGALVFASAHLAFLCSAAQPHTPQARAHAVTSWFALAGAFAGIAMSIKLTGGLLALSVGAAIALMLAVRALSWGQAVRAALAAGAAFTLVYAPWALRSLLLYGNPVYPFLFGGLEWDSARAGLFAFSTRGLLADGLWWQLPILPFAATVFGVHNGNGFGFSAGPWLLTAWVFLWPAWPVLPAQARRGVMLAGALLVPLLVGWGISAAGSIVGQQTRLMMGALPLFAVCAAVAVTGVERLPRKPIAIGFIVRAVIAFTLALNLLDVTTAFVRDRAAAPLLGLMTAEGWRYEQTGAYAPAMRELAALERAGVLRTGARVRFFWEPRGYHCPETLVCAADLLFDHWSRPQIPAALIDQSAVHAQLPPDFDAVRARYADDAAWLVFDTGYEAALAESPRPRIDGAFRAFLDRYMQPVWTDGVRYTLWQWRAVPAR